MTVKIAAIVEGHGESEAAPVLIRRIGTSIDPGLAPVILRPLRISASKLRRPGEVERAVELAARKLEGFGGIVILLDCDWTGGCPALDAPLLLERATAARSDLPIAVVLAKQEFENWFLAAANSLRGKRGLRSDVEAPDNVEAIRGAKEWLSDRMARRYSPTQDQAALAAVLDLTEARTAPSFDKFYRDVERILLFLRGRG